MLNSLRLVPLSSLIILFILALYVFLSIFHMERKSTEVWLTQKRGNSYRKSKEISRRNEHINTRKLHRNISMITDVFLNQKRVNVCEYIWWVALFRNSHVVPSLPWVHIHLFSSDRERHLWLSKHFSEASMCLCVSFARRSLCFLFFFPRQFFLIPYLPIKKRRKIRITLVDEVSKKIIICLHF